MPVEPRTLKGFRDFLPNKASHREFVKKVLKDTFSTFGFEPLETPSLEYEEILSGKYGEEGDKLMYRFEDNGGRKVALRYDQTVPLARVIAQFQNDIPLPFKRFQMQNVWRAENTQRGRFREFLQCDIDTVGASSPLADAEIIACAYESYSALGFDDIQFLINDRLIFNEVSKGTITSIDKLNKIGRQRVVEELISRGEYDSSDKAEKILIEIEQSEPTNWIEQVIDCAKKMGVPDQAIKFSPTLARGLDYYTSTIIEAITPSYEVGSLGGGGRYDKLIGLFSNKAIPAVGFAFGFDRVIEAMDDLGLFPQENTHIKALVTVFSEELRDVSLRAVRILRLGDIPTDIYLEEDQKMEKQIKYALKKQIPHIVIIGPEEKEKGIASIKNLKTGIQTNVLLENLADAIEE